MKGMSSERDLLESAVQYLREDVAPRAQAIDLDPEALQGALEGLCARGLMALRCPEKYGGPEFGEEAFRTFQEEVARASGSLAFLQTQHQSAAAMIARSPSEELREDYLPEMVHGDRLVGIGFSQLRRPGPPAIYAQEYPGGYLLQGEVPWITGYRFFEEFVVGAMLPSGDSLFAVVPFQPMEGLSFSDPMRLAAMESARTVRGAFERFFVPEEQVVFLKPKSWIQNNDQINIALQGHFAIGCAQAGLDVLGQAAEAREMPVMHEAFAALSEELAECREATREAQHDLSEESTPERLEVRAWAIDLAVRCAHAAVTASSGAANSLRHPAQRVYREALVYTVSAQTPPILEATLRRLVRRPRVGQKE